MNERRTEAGQQTLPDYPSCLYRLSQEGRLSLQKLVDEISFIYLTLTLFPNQNT